jgi:tetratricopeptide (TPR) repeat protein
MTRTNLAEKVASRERERLNRLALEWDISEKLVAHLVMCVTLQGGCGAEEALQLVIDERRAMGFPEAGAAEDLVDRLGAALPAPDNAAVDAVRPDLIGEAFLLQGMRERQRFPKLQAEIIERAWLRVGRKVATTLIRIAQDYAQGDASHCSVVWLQHLTDQTDDSDALRGVAEELPKRSLALRELAAVVLEKIEAGLADIVTGEPELLSALGDVQMNLATRLSDLGRDEAALIATEKALALYRKLAAQQPDRFRSRLAMSANNFAATLSGLHSHEAALAAVEEAITIFRELAAQQPDAFHFELAGSLANCSNALSALGRHEPALVAAAEAVAILRELAASRPHDHDFRPTLAVALYNHALRLSAVGQDEAALIAAEEGLAIGRELAG